MTKQTQVAQTLPIPKDCLPLVVLLSGCICMLQALGQVGPACLGSSYNNVTYTEYLLSLWGLVSVAWALMRDLDTQALGRQYFTCVVTNCC